MASSSGCLFVASFHGAYDYTAAEIVREKGRKSRSYSECKSATTLPDKLNTTVNGFDFGSSFSTGLINVQGLCRALLLSPGQKVSALQTAPPLHQLQGNIQYHVHSRVIQKSSTSDFRRFPSTPCPPFRRPSTVHHPIIYMNDTRFGLRLCLSGNQDPEVLTSSVQATKADQAS